MKHLNMLSFIKDKLSPIYNHTRCPLCFYVIDVDGNGDMEAHGSGQLPCEGSGWKDEELAEKLDKDERITASSREIVSDGEATH